MEEDKRSVVNHFETGSNCQVFNGNITGCVFAMPGSNVTQQAAQPTDSCGAENRACTNEPPAADAVGGLRRAGAYGDAQWRGFQREHIQEIL